MSIIFIGAVCLAMSWALLKYVEIVDRHKKVMRDGREEK
jgi:hypothetical protein